jgi:hypothetical protein
MKIQLKVTITKVFEAEVVNTTAVERMLKTLKTVPLSTVTGMGADGWSLRQISESHIVEEEVP